MKVELVNTVHSGLPPDDDHPYRSGAWQPQQREYDAWDMDVVGEIPDDLSGVYIRNTENPLFEPIKRYHPFDGDAMLHSISFAGREATYRNRFVRTDGLSTALSPFRRRSGLKVWVSWAWAMYAPRHQCCPTPKTM